MIYSIYSKGTVFNLKEDLKMEDNKVMKAIDTMVELGEDFMEFLEYSWMEDNFLRELESYDEMMEGYVR